jgi:hypothetical protein
MVRLCVRKRSVALSAGSPERKLGRFLSKGKKVKPFEVEKRRGDRLPHLRMILIVGLTVGMARPCRLWMTI